MSHFKLNPHRRSGQTSSLPFRLAFKSSPSSLREARQDGGKRALVQSLNDSIDHCDGLLGRAASYDGQPEDLNENPGEVLLLNQRFGRTKLPRISRFIMKFPSRAFVATSDD